MVRVFVDSDVIISSLLSSRGAAYFLLHEPRIQATVSTISELELSRVCDRLGIPSSILHERLRERCDVVELLSDTSQIQKEFEKYVVDENDAHVVAGAQAAEAKYLITYNLKHFRAESIKESFDILVMTPALFLQYLRSNQ